MKISLGLVFCFTIGVMSAQKIYPNSVYLGTTIPGDLLSSSSHTNVEPSVCIGVVANLLEEGSRFLWTVGLELSNLTYKRDSIDQDGFMPVASGTRFTKADNIRLKQLLISPSFNMRFYLTPTRNWYISSRVFLDIPIYTHSRYNLEYTEFTGVDFKDYEGTYDQEYFFDEPVIPALSVGISRMFSFNDKNFSIGVSYKAGGKQFAVIRSHEFFRNSGFQLRASYFFEENR